MELCEMDYSDYEVKICIIGMGMAGLGFALKLAESDLAEDSLIIDGGNNLQERVCNLETNNLCLKHDFCNVISGFGGCSFISGSKISYYPAGSKIGNIVDSEEILKEKMLNSSAILNPYLNLSSTEITNADLKYALEYYKSKGFTFKYYTSITFDPKDFQSFLRDLHDNLTLSGIKISFETKINSIKVSNSKFELSGLRKGHPIKIRADKVIVAVGRIGKDLIKNINQELNLNGVPNYLDVGVRLEFPTWIFPEIDEYHNDLKLLFNNSRTYCVCKGGKIISYCADGIQFSEGQLDKNKHTTFTNLAILTRLEPSPQNEEICNQIKQKCRMISRGKLINQNLEDYLFSDAGKHRDVNKTNLNSVEGDINKCFPQHVSIQIKNSVEKFVSAFIDQKHWSKIEVFAPEIINEGINFEMKTDFSVLSGLYLIGECTGKFRGILQSFCSGSICADKIVGEQE